MDNNTFAIKALVNSLERAIEEGNIDVVRTISEEILRATGGTPAPAPVAEKDDTTQKIERLNKLFEKPYSDRYDLIQGVSRALGIEFREVNYNSTGRTEDGIYWKIEYGNDGYTARFF